MKRAKSSLVNLQQSKITAFCIKKYDDDSEIDNVKVKKRKINNENDNCVSPIKLAPELKSEISDLLSKSPEKINSKTEVVETENVQQHFFFEDFENDLFLSPVKKKSPKKGVLTENGSQLVEKENWGKENLELTFETVVKCLVLKSEIISHGQFEQILLVKNEANDKKGICKLRDVWTFSLFSVGDLVSIQAVLSEEGWLVDNKYGFIILFPDVIISSTSLASSFFCLRQGVLCSFYKGIDGSNKDKMIIGRLVHELLQESLKFLSCSDDDFVKIIKNLLHSRDYLRDFYFSNLNINDIQKEMEDFVPQIKVFLETYIYQKTSPTKNNFNGTIEKILDIEELIQSSTMGIKGRIDVTVKTKSKNLERITPLELKTGKATFSNEHKSQLTLYILLMNEIGRKVESGLLLYLKDGAIKEVIPQRDEIRNLFLLRNQFVKYYKGAQQFNFPDPIRNSKACSKCPYLRVCTTYLKMDENTKLSETHPLGKIEMPDIKPDHRNYFIEWHKMLWLEYGEMFEEKTKDLELSSLTLQSTIETIRETEFKHTFIRSSSSREKIFSAGKFVQVFNEKNNRVGIGRVTDVSNAAVSVVLENKLEDFSVFYKIIVFQNTFLNLYLTNLGWLLNEEFEMLRQIIIEKKSPSFKKKMYKKEFQEKCLKFLVTLNQEQQKAILKSLLTTDYLLIKGPPGTGKSHTVVILVKILVALGKKILISSHTHSSVDNILLKLDDIEFLRLGSLKSIHKAIHGKCYATLIENCRNVEDLKKLFERKVIASTCSGLDVDFVQKEKFDVCIIDESSQVLQPEILRPLFCCKKFILIGDEDQLPPIVQNFEAKKMGMDKSLFEWLTNEKATISLRYQYRMNSVINSLANSIAYNGLLECANEEVANATLAFSNLEAYHQSDIWIKDVLSCDLKKSVIFIETSSFFKSTGNVSSEKMRSSILEANIILVLVSSLIKFGLSEEGIGVIAPFCDQVSALKNKFAKVKLNNLELNTVDQYQGRDKKVIFFSCAKENNWSKIASESELLNDKRRLTVAVTRAKHKLILVGDSETVKKYKPFETLLKSLQEFQIYRLMNGSDGFLLENFIK